MNQAGFALPKVQPLSLLIYLPDSSWSSPTFISVFLGAGGGVEGSSSCGIQSCVGKDIYLPDLGCNTLANAVSGIGLSIYSPVSLLKYLPECLPNLIFFPIWVSAFSSENVVSSSVRLYLPQFWVFFLPFSFGQKKSLPPVDFLISFFLH